MRPDGDGFADGGLAEPADAPAGHGVSVARVGRDDGADQQPADQGKRGTAARARAPASTVAQ
jgi:hypothetical protein